MPKHPASPSTHKTSGLPTHLATDFHGPAAQQPASNFTPDNEHGVRPPWLTRTTSSDSEIWPPESSVRLIYQHWSDRWVERSPNRHEPLISGTPSQPWTVRWTRQTSGTAKVRSRNGGSRERPLARRQRASVWFRVPLTAPPSPLDDRVVRYQLPATRRVTAEPVDSSAHAIIESLRQLKALHDEGILTDDEYQAKRQRLADQL